MTWKEAIVVLRRRGHDDLANELNRWKSAHNDKKGWDAWFKSDPHRKKIAETLLPSILGYHNKKV